MHECVICKLHNRSEIKNLPNDSYSVSCERCGNYEISRSNYVNLQNNINRPPHTVSSWIKEQNRLYDSIPVLTTENMDMLISMPDRNLDSKLEALVLEVNRRFLVDKNRPFGNNEKEVRIIEGDNEWLSITWSRDYYELKSILDEIHKMGLFDIARGQFKDKRWVETISNISFQGRHYIESLGTVGKTSNKVFMAFHFTEEMKNSFEVTVRKVISDISNGQLEATRVSTLGTSTDTKIDDELISMIKASKVVIADFTGHRTAVYYEAGFAMGLGIPVIWTCRADHIEDLSFDTRQYPHILWENKEDLYKQLTQRINAQIL